MQDTVQLFTAQNGQLSAKVVFPDATTRHIHSLVDPAVEGRFFERLDFWGNVIVFAGTGLGYHLFPRLHAIPQGALIIAVDYYEALIDHCRKHVFSKIKNPLITFSEIYSDEEAAKAASLIRQKPLVKIQVIKHPASFDMQRRFYETVLDRLFSPLAKNAEGGAPTLNASSGRSALVLYGNFFLEEEILNAFRVNGIVPAPFPYNDYVSPLAYENALLKKIQETRPSFIFSVNMKGIDAGGGFAEAAARFGIPVVVWFVDDPRRILSKQLQCGISPPNIIAASWERFYLPWLERAGFSKVLYLPLATDPSLFQAASPASPSVKLGFVGTSMVDDFAGKIKEKFLWSDRLQPLVEEASEKLLANPEYHVDNDITACAKRLSIDIPFSDSKNISWLCAYIVHTASMKKRQRIVGGLIGDGIETFGDAAGWKHLLGPPIPTHPDIDYRHGLADIYRDIRINVNVTSCQMPWAVNQRVFDIPCAGGFVISDDQKDLHELFDVGKEAIAYECLDDLKEKIRFFTEHENERTRIIRAAQKRILGEHTYAKRIGNLLQRKKNFERRQKDE